MQWTRMPSDVHDDCWERSDLKLVRLRIWHSSTPRDRPWKFEVLDRSKSKARVFEGGIAVTLAAAKIACEVAAHRLLQAELIQLLVGRDIESAPEE